MVSFAVRFSLRLIMLLSRPGYCWRFSCRPKAEDKERAWKELRTPVLNPIPVLRMMGRKTEIEVVTVMIKLFGDSFIVSDYKLDLD